MRRGNSTEAIKSMCPNVTGGVQAVGRCTDVCDQLYDTCPVPADLPRGTPPPRGGPIGSDPPKKPAFKLTPAAMRTALARGAVTLPASAAAPPAGSTRLGSLQDRLRSAVSQISGPLLKGLLAADRADALASRVATPSTSGVNATRARAEQGLIINTGDSWAIRNDNCEIAPIHGILNRVRHGPGSCHTRCNIQRWASLPATVTAGQQHGISIPRVVVPMLVCMPPALPMPAHVLTSGGCARQYNKFIMIDRIFFEADGQTPNPYGILASEYDVTTNTFRDLSSGITSNSWCSAVQPSFGTACHVNQAWPGC